MSLAQSRNDWAICQIPTVSPEYPKQLATALPSSRRDLPSTYMALASRTGCVINRQLILTRLPSQDQMLEETTEPTLKPSKRYDCVDIAVARAEGYHEGLMGRPAGFGSATSPQPTAASALPPEPAPGMVAALVDAERGGALRFAPAGPLLGIPADDRLPPLVSEVQRAIAEAGAWAHHAPIAAQEIAAHVSADPDDRVREFVELEHNVLSARGLLCVAG
jgi:hypothetical protein